MERKDLGSRVWVRGEGERAREGELRELGRVNGSLGERGERFKCCGAQNHQLDLDRSPILVRPVRAELGRSY